MPVVFTLSVFFFFPFLCSDGDLNGHCCLAVKPQRMVTMVTRRKGVDHQPGWLLTGLSARHK
jgi:hypothetical protein